MMRNENTDRAQSTQGAMRLTSRAGHCPQHLESFGLIQMLRAAVLKVSPTVQDRLLACVGNHDAV